MTCNLQINTRKQKTRENNRWIHQKKYEISSTLTIKRPPVFIVNFKHISYFFYSFYYWLWNGKFSEMVWLKYRNTEIEKKISVLRFWHCFIKSPANICLFKLSNRNSRKKCEIYSKFTIKTPERRQWRRLCVYVCVCVCLCVC